MPIRGIVPGLAGASLALLALNACVPSARAPAPVPAPAPPPRPVASLPPPAPPPPTDWQTGPLSPGNWRYAPSQNGTGASFPSDISSARLLFAIQCGQRRVILAISGAQGDALLIHTSYGTRRLPAGRVHLSEMIVELQPSDPLLDQMAFSRGRFLVQVEGGPSLVVPAWPEFARVIEDCRGQ